LFAVYEGEDIVATSSLRVDETVGHLFGGATARYQRENWIWRNSAAQLCSCRCYAGPSLCWSASHRQERGKALCRYGPSSSTQSLAAPPLVPVGEELAG
jgi:hypothetical protein